MRTIKFRAWDKFYKIMLNEFGNGSEELKVKGVNETISLYCNDGNWELMEFTGARDKDEKEIWEGDIIKFKIENEEEGVVECIEQVQYADSSFVIGNGNIPLNAFANECAVIGNIYEKPTLLSTFSK